MFYRENLNRDFLPRKIDRDFLPYFETQNFYREKLTDIFHREKLDPDSYRENVENAQRFLQRAQDLSLGVSKTFFLGLRPRTPIFSSGLASLGQIS